MVLRAELAPKVWLLGAAVGDCPIRAYLLAGVSPQSFVQMRSSLRGS